MYFLTLILKNVIRRKARSFLTLIGVAVAVAAVVALVGISTGFEQSFLSLYQQRGVDLIVVRAGSTERLASSLPESFGEKIRSLPQVQAVSPGLVDVVAYPEHDLINVPIQGWAADSFMFDDLKFTSGRRLQATDQQAANLGTLLARNLGKKVGDKADIEGRDFQVVGIFESFSQFENGSAIVLISELQKLLERPNQVNGFQVILKNAPDKHAAVEAARKEIEALKDPGGKTLDLAALPTQDYVKSTSQIQLAHAMAWLTSAIALVIGGVGMLNTMMMSVFERTREIGILRAIGWGKGRIIRMILYESFILSIGGALVGILGAVVLTRLLSRLPAASGLVEGKIAPAVIGEGFLIALAVGLVGGVYPAIRAARLLPTEALRHE